MQVASHHLLTPGLVLTTVANAIEATASDRTDAVLHVESRVEIDRHGTQTVSDVMITNNGANDAGTLGRLHVFNVLNAADPDLFEQARVARIDIDLRLEFARDMVTIVDAQLPSDTVDPGKPVTLAVTLRRFDQSEQVELVPIITPRAPPARAWSWRWKPATTSTSSDPSRTAWTTCCMRRRPPSPARRWWSRPSCKNKA